MKNHGKWLLFLLYGAAAAGFCIMQYLRYTGNFEEIFPYEHSFTLSEPAEELWLELNSATAAQLAKLPGVSRPLADNIAAYRKELGGFTSITQLADVPGMPDALYIALGEYLYLAHASETQPETTASEPCETSIPEVTAFVPPTELHLNLNTASAEELCLLPEVGEETAQKIVAYRAQIGGFLNRRQLLEVDGIGEKTYAAIADYLYLPEEFPLPTEPPVVEVPEPVTPEPIPDATEPVEIPVINLNTATREELLLLPGCSEELADSILTLRDNIHVFSNILEINYAEGMTVTLYTQWEKYLAVDSEGNPMIQPTT